MVGMHGLSGKSSARLDQCGRPSRYGCAAQFIVPLLACVVVDVEGKFVVHAAAVEMPERLPWQIAHRLAAGTIGVDDQVVTGNNFGQAGSFAFDDGTRRSPVELRIGVIKPCLADAFQTTRSWCFPSRFKSNLSIQRVEPDFVLDDHDRRRRLRMS
jgi:hypothetical protein